MSYFLSVFDPCFISGSVLSHLEYDRINLQTAAGADRVEPEASQRCLGLEEDLEFPSVAMTGRQFKRDAPFLGVMRFALLVSRAPEKLGVDGLAYA
jgi:hypothetical protein